MRVMTPRGLLTRFGEAKVAPLSVPVSHGKSATVLLCTHCPFSMSGRPRTPANQSGLGAIIVTSVTSGCVRSIWKRSVDVPAPLEMLLPESVRFAVPAAIAAFTSASSVVLPPSSAMSCMPVLEFTPGCQNSTPLLCNPPTSPDQCAPAGKSVGWVVALQVALKTTSYSAVGSEVTAMNPRLPARLTVALFPATGVPTGDQAPEPISDRVQTWKGARPPVQVSVA